jgi:hypothetical protein
LHEAIANANSNDLGAMHDDCAYGQVGGHDLIRLPSGGQFELLTPATSIYDSDTGLPSITSHITIEGNGATIRRPAGAGRLFRLMAVTQAGRLELSNLNLEGGVASLGFGGAVANAGTLLIHGGVFRDNGAADGGAIGNIGFLSVVETTLSGNGATGRGGAISNELVHNGFPGGGTTSLNAVRLIGNAAMQWGGGLSSRGGVVTVLQSAIQGNSSRLGGGVSASDTKLTVDSSTISGNTAEMGGGLIIKYSATGALANSTISGNTATQRGGGLFVGGEIYAAAREPAVGNKVSIAGATLSQNEAPRGGGISFINAGASSLTLAHSLISGNRASIAGREVEGGNSVLVDAYNLFGFNGDAGVVGFTPGENDIVPGAGVPNSAILNPILSDNGGRTATHALISGSPAIDVVYSEWCATPPIAGRDQRGQSRNRDGNGQSSINECDVGAFEFQPAAPPPTPEPTPSPTPPPGGPFRFAIPVIIR